MAERVYTPSKAKYTYDTDWGVYNVAWSNRPDKPFRVGITSFLEDYTNVFQICQLNIETGKIEQICESPHPYPATGIKFLPNPLVSDTDLFGVSGDYLRLYEINKNDNSISLCAFLDKNKRSDSCAPLTCFDWSCSAKSRIATGSIDSTVNIWDISKVTTLGQICAHEKDVFDISYNSSNDNRFVTAGADRTCRIFDLRTSNMMNIIFEGQKPIIKAKWNPINDFQIAVLEADSAKVSIVDLRLSMTKLFELSNAITSPTATNAPFNNLCWATYTSSLLVTAGSDGRVIVWDTAGIRDVDRASLEYTVEPNYSNIPNLIAGQVNSVDWGLVHTDWIAATTSNRLELLHI